MSNTIVTGYFSSFNVGSRGESMRNIGVPHDWYLMCSVEEYQMSSSETSPDFYRDGMV